MDFILFGKTNLVVNKKFGLFLWPINSGSESGQVIEVAIRARSLPHKAWALRISWLPLGADVSRADESAVLSILHLFIERPRCVTL